MVRKHRQGQSLIETLVLTLSFVLLIYYLEVFYERSQSHYYKTKVQGTQPLP